MSLLEKRVVELEKRLLHVEEDFDARLHDLEFPCQSESEAEEGVSGEASARDSNELLLHQVVRSSSSNDESSDCSFSEQSEHESSELLSSSSDLSAADAIVALSSLDESSVFESSEGGWIARPNKELGASAAKRKAPALALPAQKKVTPEWRRVPSKMRDVIEGYCHKFFAINGDAAPLAAWYDEQMARVAEVLGCSTVEFGKMVLAIKADKLHVPAQALHHEEKCRFCSNVAVNRIAQNSYYFPQAVLVCAKCTMATWMLQELVVTMEGFCKAKNESERVHRTRAPRSKVDDFVRAESEMTATKNAADIFMSIACTLM